MDRFINLCNGDTLFATEDAARTNPLPIEDLLWSEGSPSNLEEYILELPSLDTLFNTTVRQMARECHLSHFVGRVIRYIFNLILDPGFNTEEAVLLKRTLAAYQPLLADEELRIGKYCGAFRVCERYIVFSHTPR